MSGDKNSPIELGGAIGQDTTEKRDYFYFSTVPPKGQNSPTGDVGRLLDQALAKIDYHERRAEAHRRIKAELEKLIILEVGP